MQHTISKLAIYYGNIPIYFLKKIDFFLYQWSFIKLVAFLEKHKPLKWGGGETENKSTVIGILKSPLFGSLYFSLTWIKEKYIQHNVFMQWRYKRNNARDTSLSGWVLGCVYHRWVFELWKKSTEFLFRSISSDL